MTISEDGVLYEGSVDGETVSYGPYSYIVKVSSGYTFIEFTDQVLMTPSAGMLGGTFVLLNEDMLGQFRVTSESDSRYVTTSPFGTMIDGESFSWFMRKDSHTSRLPSDLNLEGIIDQPEHTSDMEYVYYKNASVLCGVGENSIIFGYVPSNREVIYMERIALNNLDNYESDDIRTDRGFVITDNA